MHAETLHIPILLWEKKMVNKLRRHFGIGIQYGKMFSFNQKILKKMIELPWCHDCKLNHLFLHYFVQIFNSLILIIFTFMCSCGGTNCIKTVNWATNSEDPTTNVYVIIEILSFSSLWEGKRSPYIGGKSTKMNVISPPHM